MTDQVLGLQWALVEWLKGLSALEAYVADRIYDAVPRTKVYPYVTVGEISSADASADCTDSETITARLNIWSQQGGKSVQAKEIGGIIKTAIRSAVLDMPAGLRLLSITFRDANYLIDRDGLTAHGIVTLEALTESEATVPSG